MNEYEDFARCVEKFFMEYLVKERGTSHHTIRSYRDTLVLFITYMQDKEHVKAENLSFYHINRKTVIGFLNWLQDERRSSASTRNQRYAAIRSFFRFMICEDPKHMSQWKDICTIRLKRASKKSISYLTIDAVKYLLYLEPSKQLQTMKNTWRQTFVYQLLLDFNTSNLLFGGSQKSAYLCNAFLPRRILRAFILPSRGQS